MISNDNIQRRRREILEELTSLERIRRGSITEQFVEAVGREGGRRRRGPYPLYTFKAEGKTVSRRLKAEHVALYQEQVLAGHHFQKLMRELMELGEKLCDHALSADAEKKTPKF